MESYGYAGRILHVDLTTGKSEVEALDRELARSFIGGWGMNAKLAYDHVKPRIDAYSPEMPIILGAGVLGGTIAPASAKSFVTTKCPTSGTVSTAVGGSNLSAALKWAGYDHMIITGKAQRPVYLKIVDDDVQIRDASDLWGKDLVEATEELRDRHGGTCAIACIGPAGENLVRISIALVNRLSTFGRSLGGNMGSKKLKAIVVDGTKGTKVAQPRNFMRMVDNLTEKFMEDPLREKWTSLALFYIQRSDAEMPCRNSRELMSAEEGEELVRRFGAEEYLKRKIRTLTCVSCPSGDKAAVGVKEGPLAGLFGVQSTPSSLDSGYKMGMENMDWSIKYLDLLNRYGLDGASMHRLIEWAIDLYQNEVITKADCHPDQGRGPRFRSQDQLRL